MNCELIIGFGVWVSIPFVGAWDPPRASET